MMNEVQLIAWREAIDDTLLYSEICLSAQSVGEPLNVHIAPIAGVSAGDLQGKWILLTNSLGQSQYFPIVNSYFSGGDWLISTFLYPDSEFDFTISTYQILERTYTGNTENECVSQGSVWRINGDVTFLEGKILQINMDNGESYMGIVIGVSYIVVNDWTLIQLNSLSPVVNNMNGNWSFAFDTAPYYIQLYPNESISQTWRFTDISNFGTTGSFSREFRIPATEENTKVFGLVEQVNFNDDLNYFHTKLKAEIRVSTFPIAVGHIRLMKTYTQNGKYADLELSFYAETPDLTRAIGTSKLKELSQLPLLDHPISYDSVTGAEAVIAFGDILAGGDTENISIIIDTQPALMTYIGKTLVLTSGLLSTTRVIIDAQIDSEITDKLYWSIGLDESYIGGTWEVLSTGINDAIKYALCDRAQRWDETGVAQTRRISDTNLPMYAGDMTPHLNAWWIFSNILSDAGFQLNPTPLESILSSYWSPWINSQSLQVNSQDNGYLFRAQLATDTAFDYGDFLIFPEVYDNNGDFLAGGYDPPFPAYYTFRVWLTFIPVNLYGGNQSISFQLTQGGSTIRFVHSVFISQADAISGQPINVQFTTPPLFVDLSLGVNTFKLITYTYYNGTIFKGGATYDPFNGTGWELVSITNPLYDATLLMNQNAPDVKQIDFIKDIIAMHCCAVVPDIAKPSVLNIVPMSDYVNSGNTIDWTQKLDISKDIILLPTTDKQKKNIVFTYKNGGDVASKFYVDNGRTYGEYKIDGYQVNPEDSSNDFAEGELKVQLTAESNPCNYINGTSLVISKYVNDKWEFVVPNLRFVYMAGTGIVKMYNEITDEVLDTEVLVTNHYSESYSDIADYDLNFSPEVPLHVIESNPYKNLFNLYWREYMNELYSPKARILEASFALDVMDVQSFSFADKIWVNDSYWRILEVTDYKVGMNESTRVLLIKTDIGVPDCSSVPSGDDNGQISFVDFNGDPVPATATCCLRYGYDWNSQLNWCIGRGESTNAPDPTGGASAMTMIGSMKGQNAQPSNRIAMVTGSAVDVGNDWSTYVGRDIKIDAGNQFTTAQGDYLELKDGQPSSAIFGSNVHAPIKGLHFGGGWRGERLSESKGSQQGGIVIMGNSTSFTFNGDYIEVAVGNETLTRLVMEDGTHWSCIINIHISDHVNFWATSVYSVQLWKKTGGSADSSAPIQLAIDDSIGNQFDVAPTIDTRTDITQHRIKIQLNDIGGSPYSFPTPEVKVVATIQYSQSR